MQQVSKKVLTSAAEPVRTYHEVQVPLCDAELSRDRAEAQKLMRAYNSTIEEDDAVRQTILSKLLGSIGDNVTLREPVFLDYGYNVVIGSNVFLNFGCVFLDVCKIEIGDGCQIGPGVHFYAADHPRDPEKRASGVESGKPICVGRNVWIGGHAVILPGITIGDDAIVGAGSVVTRDVARGTTVAGNPASLLTTGTCPPRTRKSSP